METFIANKYYTCKQTHIFIFLSFPSRIILDLEALLFFKETLKKCIKYNK